MMLCVICGEPFPPRNSRSVLCGEPSCVAARKREYVRKCRATRPDQARRYAARQYEAVRTLVGCVRRRRGEGA